MTVNKINTGRQLYKHYDYRPVHTVNRYTPQSMAIIDIHQREVSVTIKLEITWVNTER